MPSNGFDDGERRAALSQSLIVGSKRGGLRTFVVCSNAYASPINVASLHWPPMNEIPTGRPWMNPAGTVTLA